MVKIVKIENKETIQYGKINNLHILDIFGEELPFNKLKDKQNQKYTDLTVENIYLEDFYLISIYFDDKVVLHKKYRKNHSCDMFYYLHQLELESDSDSDTAK